jgi:hypothetical protein
MEFALTSIAKLSKRRFSLRIAVLRNRNIKSKISSKNCLVGARINGSRGISPRNILIGSEIYVYESIPKNKPSLLKTIRIQGNKLRKR